jgi:phosphatidylglycerophosphate synthase
VVLFAPQILIAFRAACALAIVVFACLGVPGPLLAAVLVAAVLSDVLDGVIARRLGIATAGIRRADTLVDTVFFVAAAAALKVAIPEAFDGTDAPLVTLIVVHVSRATFELTKYGRVAAYHMWSSKLLGVLLAFAFAHAFLTARASAIFPFALWVGILNELEGFTASALLPAWRADVPSVMHALSLARGWMPAEDRS